MRFRISRLMFELTWRRDFIKHRRTHYLAKHAPAARFQRFVGRIDVTEITGRSNARRIRVLRALRVPYQQECSTNPVAAPNWHICLSGENLQIESRQRSFAKLYVGRISRL